MKRPTAGQQFYFALVGFVICLLAFSLGVWNPGYFFVMMCVWLVAMYAAAKSDVDTPDHRRREWLRKTGKLPPPEER